MKELKLLKNSQAEMALKVSRASLIFYAPFWHYIVLFLIFHMLLFFSNDLFVEYWLSL